MSDPVDWSDPCARAAALAAAYFSMVSGGAIQTIRSRAAGGEREVRYHKSEIATLRQEMWRAEDACRETNGEAVRRRRFSITAGSRRN